MSKIPETQNCNEWLLFKTLQSGDARQSVGKVAFDAMIRQRLRHTVGTGLPQAGATGVAEVRQVVKRNVVRVAGRGDAEIQE